MNTQDAETIIAIAALAAMADGNQSDVERESVAGAATRLGLPAAGDLAQKVASGELDVAALAGRLSDDEARHAAYETAAAVCHADGEPNASESAFLSGLARALGRTPEAAAAVASIGPGAAVPAEGSPAATDSDLDSYILDQAMLAAACELLPDRLANMVILPLQLRLVYTIGQRHGQQLNLSQAKDLAAALGIGAAAQLMESVVRKTFGGIARGLLGGLLGGTAGMAAGTAVTFAATYALGHAAERYYAQGRQLSTADLKALFSQFQTEANGIFPRVESRIRTLSSTTNLSSLVSGLRL